MSQNNIQKDVVFSVSGRAISLVDPQPESFDIDDIAHALAMQPRFNGNTQEHYSIAQHSVYVSHLVPSAWSMAALLHDASESCLGDIVSPLKRLIALLYGPIEAAVMGAIHERFRLPRELPSHVNDAIHLADLRLLATEKAQLLHFDSGHWPVLEGIEPAPLIIKPMSNTMAKHFFLSRYHELDNHSTKHQSEMLSMQIDSIIRNPQKMDTQA